MQKIRKFKTVALALAAMIIVSVVGGAVFAADSQSTGRWVTGDFHTHTYLTDGSKTEEDVIDHAFNKYGLDWMANSEHGGTSAKDSYGADLASPMWRWQSLLDMSFPVVSTLRMKYRDKAIFQSLEWNVPSHEHASVGIVSKDAKAISNFEYTFDASDKDTSKGMDGLIKANSIHADAVNGAKFLETTYPTSSYFLLNHPSRKLLYSVSDIRDFNNAAPDVAFGFEGLPGHQKDPARGGYGNDLKDNTPKARTYGGADYMVAKVGGLWDALLGEGRNFWVFVNSDFHEDTNDFWPGEYAKSYTWAKDNTLSSIVAGMRSGNSFAVHGDLINALDFNVKSGSTTGTMGSAIAVNKGDKVQVTIRFKSPAANNNGDKVTVDHIDLISGNVTAKAAPGTPEYSKDTNDSTKVIATFTKNEWKLDSNGYYSVTYTDYNASASKYYRLRGTNLANGTLNETDSAGNPLNDDLMGAGTNDSAKAYKDLWFYSNPIFITVSK